MFPLLTLRASLAKLARHEQRIRRPGRWNPGNIGPGVRGRGTPGEDAAAAFGRDAPRAGEICGPLPRQFDAGLYFIGTFALRSPARPNPLASAIVRLERIEGEVLFVRGFDCRDGTPLIDLKPAVRLGGNRPVEGAEAALK